MTTEQIQHLLVFLGYDTGGTEGIYGPMTRQAVWDFQEDFGGLTVDGIAGEETQKALRHAVAFGVEKKEEHTLPAPSGDYWDEIKYFVRQEFACRCGEYHAPYCDGFPVEPDETLVRVADRIRGNLGRPAHRTSGIRCQQHNADQPNSAKNSKHLYGKALDFFVDSVSGATLLAEVKKQPEISYAYIVSGNVVHMDVY